MTEPGSRGIASLVLDGQTRPSVRGTEPSARRTEPFVAGSLAGEVLDRPAEHAGARTVLWGVAVSLLVHGLGVAALGLAEQTPKQVAQAQPPLRVEHVVDLTAPQVEVPQPEPVTHAEPEAAPEPVNVAKAEVPRKTPRQTLRPAAEPSEAEPSAPAEAGEVVTSADHPGVLDFTEFDIPSGGGKGHPEGPISGGGRGKSGGVDPAAEGKDPPAPSGTRKSAPKDRTKPVSLPAKNWSCRWPAEANNLGIDEQVVVLRVVVDTAGNATRVELIADPGHGFGASARGCAKKARFDPARERDGRAYPATSPPIRVRFTRK